MEPYGEDSFDTQINAAFSEHPTGVNNGGGNTAGNCNPQGAGPLSDEKQEYTK
jgi:hypothetical protein